MTLKIAGGTAVLLALLGTRPLAAQTARADSLWQTGDFPAAKRAYEEVLIGDMANVRANHRLGVLLSWDNQLDSALVLVRRARAQDHLDPDLEVTEGRILSWGGHTDAAVAHYDSVIARAPDARDAWIGKALALGWAGRYDESDATYAGWLAHSPADEEALVGRARVRAWKGDLSGARSLYGETLNRLPGSAAALAGLAQVDRWEGHERIALAHVDSALRLTPNDRDALRLQRELRATLRPQLTTNVGRGKDSDDNESFWENLTISQQVADGFTLNATTGLLQTSDPSLTGDRTLGEIGFAAVRRRVGFAGGIGFRHLAPEIPAGRTATTLRGSVSFRPTSKLGLGLGVARVPYDETAALISRDLDVTSLETNAGYRAGTSLQLEGGFGAGWLNDDNRRRSLFGAATRSFKKYFSAGAYYRRLSYDHTGLGYFSPRPYTLVELRGAADRRWHDLEVRVAGGAGLQQINNGDAQNAWHGELRLTWHFRVADELSAFAGITNAASASTTGAFHYNTAGLSLRLAL